MTSEPDVRTVLAPNPSPMTHYGTNTYILGSGRVAVIDPGPALRVHHAAVLAALLPTECISHIFVTHCHLDHSGLASELAQTTGAHVYAFGPANAGRSKAMQQLASRLDIGGGEGADHGFRPDIYLNDGDIITEETWSLEAIHTPGHMGNHLCFSSGESLFSGDHVMGWSTSLVSPPDGDMTDYIASLQKLNCRQWTKFLPGHGEPISSVDQRLTDLINHRKARETAILNALSTGATDIVAIAKQVYVGLADHLMLAAQRNVLAHLIDLEGKKLVRATPYASPSATFDLA